MKPHMERIGALNAALVLFEWDDSTLAPPMASEQTAGIVGSLSAQLLAESTDSELKELLSEAERRSDLSPKWKAIVKEMNRQQRSLEKIPPEEYRSYRELLARASSIWQKAKKENDYAAFEPVLRQIVEYTRRFAQYRREREENLYDVLLKEYEPDFTCKDLDNFFGLLKKELVPLIRRAKKESEKIDDSFLHRSYDVEEQAKFNRYLAEYVGFDFDRGVILESEHPFTTNLHNKDVRITTHYYENLLESALFSTIHETGHALYEMGVDDDLTLTPVGGGASMGMHESQSRFYENVVGRSRAFWEPIYPRLAEAFPEQLKDVSLDDFIKAINKAVPSLIRTEADELTYSIHILIRYEVERLLMEGQVSLEELPRIWADKYEEYLGVRPTTDSEGILQDIHWAGGSFGYFPSYALGNAIAAQLYFHMRKEMDFDGLLREGKISQITEYLREHIHRFGMTKSSRELLRETTGEDFNPEYYVAYLKEKFE